MDLKNKELNSQPLTIGGREFRNRLFVGTGKYRDSSIIPELIQKSEAEVITVAVRRMDFRKPQDNILTHIPSHVTMLINTSGAKSAEEAVRIAKVARDAGYGNFIKIEVITDSAYLLPDNEETIKAIQMLCADGFITLPYMMPDPLIARKMEDAGAAAIMPLASPIGSGKGLLMEEMIRIIIENANVPVIVDAGLGRPSHAAQAMELGADAILVNTAIADSDDPIGMAEAFSLAVRAGRLGFHSGFSSVRWMAAASSPLGGELSTLLRGGGK